MIPLTLAEVAAVTGGSVAPEDADRRVVAVTVDSRQVREDDLFVALPGEHRHGRDFVDDALRSGAAGYLAASAVDGMPGAVVVDDPVRALLMLAAEVRRRVAPAVVAVTGSVGKTTTKDLIAAAAHPQWRTVAAPASYNNEIGVPLTLLALEAGTELVVTELGARGLGHIRRLAPVVAPDVGVVTAVAEAHLERFGDVETVARAKAELVEALAPDGTAVLNADDPRVAAMAGRTAATVVTYGLAGAQDRPPPDVSGHDVRLDAMGRASFRARTPWGEAAVRLPVAGAHQVHNALAALAAVGSLGGDITAAAGALARASVAPWRAEVCRAGGVVILNDAYNANPRSVVAALDTLVRIRRDGRTWAVLGEMAELGQASASAHDQVGRECARRGVDRLVVVGDNARRIRLGAGLEGFPDARVTTVADAAAAAEMLREQVQPGDVVLVKASRVAGLEQVAAGLMAHLAEERDP